MVATAVQPPLLANVAYGNNVVTLDRVRQEAQLVNPVAGINLTRPLSWIYQESARFGLSAHAQVSLDRLAVAALHALTYAWESTHGLPLTFTPTPVEEHTDVSRAAFNQHVGVPDAWDSLAYARERALWRAAWDLARQQENQ